MDTRVSSQANVVRSLPAQDQRQHARLVAEADQHGRNVNERDTYVRSIAAKVGVAVSGALRPVLVVHSYSMMHCPSVKLNAAGFSQAACPSVSEVLNPDCTSSPGK